MSVIINILFRKIKPYKITEYIDSSEKRVIILSNQAAVYFIPLKISNGFMDLPFLGNMGKDGEDELIKQIQEMENVQFLIIKEDEELFYQESKKANEYIRNNLALVGEIEEFDIYEK